MHDGEPAAGGDRPWDRRLRPGELPCAVSARTAEAFGPLRLLEAPIHVPAVTPGPVATRIFADANGEHGRPEVAGHRKIMRDLPASQGIPRVEAGRINLDGIAARQLFVSPHPEMSARTAAARAEHLATSSAPALTPDLRALVAR